MYLQCKHAQVILTFKKLLVRLQPLLQEIITKYKANFLVRLSKILHFNNIFFK
jgi:hypothetical protein